MKTYALRLRPQQDLKQALEAFQREHALQASFVLTCVGSLRQAALRFANQPGTTLLEGKFEIVSLAGTFSPDGPHLHISISDHTGQTIGGHLQEGSLIFTTAEIVLGELEELSFGRPVDPETGYDELSIQPRLQGLPLKE
jgi:uncharacterized protein